MPLRSRFWPTLLARPQRRNALRVLIASQLEVLELATVVNVLGLRRTFTRQNEPSIRKTIGDNDDWALLIAILAGILIVLVHFLP
jgi:hypothetical protein